MTDEFLLSSVPWDDDDIVDREPEQGDGRHHFGHLQLYPLKVTKSFEAGNYVTIPNVTGGNFDDKDEKGLKMLKGWKPGGSQYLFVLVATKQDKDGNDFQIVKQFPSKVTRKTDPHLWGDFVLPALNKLSKAETGRMVSEGIYCEWDDIATGHKFTPEGEDEEKETKAWGNFKPHPDKASLEKAKDEFFGQFSDNVASHYPAAWHKNNSTPQETIDYVHNNKLNETMDNDKLAEHIGLIVDGRPALTQDGKPVDVDAILAEIKKFLQEMA